MRKKCIKEEEGTMYNGEGEYMTTIRYECMNVQLYIPRSTGVYTSKGGRQCKDIIYKYGLYGWVGGFAMGFSWVFIFGSV